MPRTASKTTRRPATRSKGPVAKGRQTTRAKTGAKAPKPSTATKRATRGTTEKPTGSRPRRGPHGRFAAPRVRLGMTPSEVREAAGAPECIVFGSDDHVEWQFGKRGVDPVGAPVLYVTALTFAAGRVVRIIERMAEAP